MALPLEGFKELLAAKRPVDSRFDFTPFKGKPLIELHPNKYFCSDLGFLMEKMHGGVYWTLFDAIKDRPALFQAWGIFSKNMLIGFCRTGISAAELCFIQRPNGRVVANASTGHSCKIRDLCPWNIKEKFSNWRQDTLEICPAFESDVDLKIVEGCDQLAWKIEALFSADY
jgi:hypothetical protein